MSNQSEIMTWGNLQSDVIKYCERTDDDFVSQVPRLIMLAEQRIASEVRGLGYLRILQGTMAAGNPVIEKPKSWRESSSLRIRMGTQTRTVYKRTYEYCCGYCDDTSIKGVPRFYSDYDFSHFFVVPSPDNNYTFELVFFEKPLALSDDNRTNWTTQYAPQLLLYATLLEAMPFLGEDAKLGTYKDLYLQASQSVLMESQRRELDRSSGQAA